MGSIRKVMGELLRWQSRRGSLTQRLEWLFLVTILPMAIAAALGLSYIVREERRAAEAKALEVTRLSAAAIDIASQRSVATLIAIAQSPLLDQRAFDDYEMLLERIRVAMPEWRAMSLAYPDGTIIVHTDRSAKSSLPLFDEQASMAEVLRRRAPTIGDLAKRADGQFGIAARVPVMRGDNLLYVLTGILSPAAFLRAVESQALPEDWTLSVFDSRGLRVARSRDHDRYLGTTAAPSLVELMRTSAKEGAGVTRTLEGDEVFTAYVRIPNMNWAVAIGLPTSTVAAGGFRAFSFYGGGAALSLALALLLAGMVGRSIARPVEALSASAERMGHGMEPDVPSTDIAELAGLGAAMAQSARTQSVLRNDLRQQVADLGRLHGLSEDLLLMRDARAQLQTVLTVLCELHGATKGLVSLTDPVSGLLNVQASVGFSKAALEALASLKPGQGAGGRSALENQRVVIADTETDPAFAEFREMARAEGIRAVHSTPIRGSSGRVLGVLSVHSAQPSSPGEREIRMADLCTALCAAFIERSHAESDAAASEQRLRVALDSSSVPFSVLVPVRDASGIIVDFSLEYLNRAAAADLGRAAPDLIGRCMREVSPAAWKTAGLFEHYVQAVEKDRIREIEICIGEPGSERWLQVLATPAAGKLALWSADVTQRKQQERALQAADRRKDEFLAVLAHELRNPLAPIQQAALISRAEGSTESQRRWSHDVIERQVRNMGLLLDDLLDVSRITRGKLELRKSRIELHAVLEAAVETARPDLDSKRHQLTMELPAQPVYLNADPLRLAQVVTNLLTNAARYTEPNGMIRLSASVTNRRVSIEVQDNGIGIQAEHIESIFAMFSQGHARPAHGGGGLGIGLALARGIAELHGGTLTAASPGANRGSRFTFSLPQGNVGEAAAPSTPAQPEAQTSLRILVADDNRDAADTLRAFLSMNGHEVFVAYDGVEALQRFKECNAQAVLLDIGMPGMSGYDVAREIRAQSAPGRGPLMIALTGWGQMRDKAMAEDAGFDHHLTKPVDPQGLLKLLRPSARVQPIRREGFSA